MAIAARHGAYNVRVFGSTVRGEAGPESDVDLLVDVGPTHSRWFPAGLILDLEELLGRGVDVVTLHQLDLATGPSRTHTHHDTILHLPHRRPDRMARVLTKAHPIGNGSRTSAQ